MFIVTCLIKCLNQVISHAVKGRYNNYDRFSIIFYNLNNTCDILLAFKVGSAEFNDSFRHDHAILKINFI